MIIGTLSLNINTDDLNYGAILHSWSFQQIMDSIDIGTKVETEVISYIPVKLKDFNRLRPITSYIRKNKWRTALKLVLTFGGYDRRLKKFISFQKNHMVVSKKVYSQEALKRENLKYDCLICESDVIWSPRFFDGNLDPVFFCALDNMKGKKKIIYAASMANCEFDENEKKQFIELTKYPDYISCREKYAVNFVKKNTERDANYVIDPVLLLKGEKYEQICSNRIIREPYLLLYIPLGFNRDYQRVAKKYAKEHNLKLVELSYYYINNISHKVISDAGVEDFISLIKYADVVFTNSFHAVCFSVLFHVDFYAFKRTTGKKTEDICDSLGLLDRYMDVKAFSEKAPIDYIMVEEIVQKLRDESISWLKKALQS